jgi:F-type H+-transporting ATPase subunit b
MRQDALKEIENSKRSALLEIQNQISLFSLEIAEKLLRKQLENPDAQKQLIQGYIQDLKIN